MLIIMELDAASKAKVEARMKNAEAFERILAEALGIAANVGAEGVREGLAQGRYGLTMQHGEAGLAGSVFGWMISESPPLAAVGVPSNTPASVYAAIHEFGRTIRPKKARALAIPVNAAARQAKSPRDLPGLFMVKRPGRPPLLARSIGGAHGRLEIFYVLKASVTLPARHWLKRGMQDARPEILESFKKAVMARVNG